MSEILYLLEYKVYLSNDDSFIFDLLLSNHACLVSGLFLLTTLPTTGELQG